MKKLMMTAMALAMLAATPALAQTRRTHAVTAPMASDRYMAREPYLARGYAYRPYAAARGSDALAAAAYDRYMASGLYPGDYVYAAYVAALGSEALGTFASEPYLARGYAYGSYAAALGSDALAALAYSPYMASDTAYGAYAAAPDAEAVAAFAYETVGGLDPDPSIRLQLWRDRHSADEP
jgi:hypothetical protein